MNRTAATTASELKRFDGSICFVLDSSSLLYHEKQEVVEQLSECLEVFQKAKSMDAAVIPLAVMGELNAGKHWESEAQDVADIRRNELKNLLPVRKMVASWKSEKPVAIAQQEKGDSWELFNKFVRSPDGHILSCALYYRGLRGGETNTAQQRPRPIQKLRPNIEGIDEVVLVTEDQLMGLRATAVYGMKSISVSQLYDIVFRSSR